MDGLDLTGVGAVLVGLAAVIGSVASFVMTIKNTKKITDIDHAVNGKKVGAQPMVDQVDDLHSDRPAPPELPPEMNGLAIKQMLQFLVAAETERSKGKKKK